MMNTLKMISQNFEFSYDLEIQLLFNNLNNMPPYFCNNFNILCSVFQEIKEKL